MVKKLWCLFVSTEHTNVTNTQTDRQTDRQTTDRQTPHDGIVRAYACIARQKKQNVSAVNNKLIALFRSTQLTSNLSMNHNTIAPHFRSSARLTKLIKKWRYKNWVSSAIWKRTIKTKYNRSRVKYKNQEKSLEFIINRTITPHVIKECRYFFGIGDTKLLILPNVKLNFGT